MKEEKREEIESDNRKFLRKSDTIKLKRRPDNEQAEMFVITGRVGKGGSSVCYSAECNGRSGRLKEFYPVEEKYTRIERARNRQLVPVGAGMTNRFKKMCSDFVDAYSVLEKVKNENSQNEVLNNYIPPCEIFYGCPEGDSEAASVYVWTPDDKKGENFSDYLKKVRKHPRQKPVHKLYNIICTIITVADCVKAMHTAGLLHMDIKPSNFLVTYDSNFNITPNISMFDVNTIYSIESDIPRCAGTIGYRAPEVKEGEAENRADIYSIGAMLFNAIVVSDSVPLEVYDDEYYLSIPALLASSKLIEATEINANINLQDMLANILAKCLACDVDQRYCNCEELIYDLNKAKNILLPEIVNESIVSLNKRLEFIEIENDEKYSPIAVIQNLLYKSPLKSKNGEINVLVIGAGTYAQMFIDNCLQVGQIPDCELNITSISEDSGYWKKKYLQIRPELNKFVNVNGSLDGSGKESYATLNFEDLPNGYVRFKTNSPGVNKKIVEAILNNATSDEYQYIFISMSDELNYEVAKLFVAKVDKDCPVNFVVQTPAQSTYRKGNPVYMNRVKSLNAIDPDLERMAFNVHLSWNDMLNVDVRKAYKDFCKKYNYESSMMFALSIQYKLRHLGIEVNQYESLDAVADKYAECIGARKSEKDAEEIKVYNKLVAFEHRRWVMEKLINSWKAPVDEEGNIDYEGCAIKGSVKDTVNKLHPCIVRCTDEMPLLGEEYKEKNRKRWNRPDEDEVLDELDSVSVGLHRCFKKHAEEFKRKNPLSGGDVQIIRQKIINEDDNIIKAYNRYVLCLKNILNGSGGYTKQYDHYEKMFKKSLENLPNKLKSDIEKRVDQIKKDFFPVIEFNMYRNYKAYDGELISKIPFILTYVPQRYVAMAFDDGRASDGKNSTIFKNVAAATVINPAKITYLYYFDETSDATYFINKLGAVLNYFNIRGMHTQIHFSIAFAEDISSGEKDAVMNGLEEMVKSKRLNSYTMAICIDESDAMEKLLQTLYSKRIDLFDITTSLFTLEHWKKQFVAQVEDDFNCFEFNTLKKKFTPIKGCEFLKYVKDNVFMRIDDMFALKKAEDNKFNLPDFASDYEALWDIYSGGYKKNGNAENFGQCVNSWNRLCDRLQKYSEKQDRLVDIDLSLAIKGESKCLIYFFPDYAYDSAEYLIDKLKECKVINEKSVVGGYASDTCRAMIYTDYNISDEMDILFSKLYLMADYRFLKVEPDYNKREIIRVVFDNLKVDGMALDKNDFNGRNLYQILNKLKRAHFIVNLNYDEDKKTVSFVYTSKRMKKLLTKSGEILEVYTYYEVLKTGYFDDVVSGYEFKWEHGNVKNELDCVITKGFRSLIIECKGTKKLEDKFYTKLGSIAEQFGINCNKVLIGNTYEHNGNLDEDNDTQKSRGEQMDIITISKPDDIMNIGEVLKKIIEKKY